MRTLLWLTAVTLAILLGAFGPISSAKADEFPTVIRLPDGWLPEGIAVGFGNTLYSGSRRHGGIYAVNLETGEGRVLAPGGEGRAATGLKFDTRTGYIFASGAATGDLRVYDSATGADVASYKLAATPGPTFINDVIITHNAAYLTDSMRPVLYRVPLGSEGQLPPASEVQILPLSGDYTHQAGFNVNGIEASSSGSQLIIVQTSTGRLFEVDPGTGRATAIDIREQVRADGLLLIGNTLYAVINANDVLKIELAPSLRSGRVVDHLTNAGFDSPTTIARSGNKLYVVSARFMSGNAPSISYTVVTLDHWGDDGD